MPEYRAYIVRSDSHFSDFRVIECADDQEAMEKRQDSLLTATTFSFGNVPARLPRFSTSRKFNSK